MLQKVFGDETMSRTTTHEWYRRFKDGRTSIGDDPRPGRPSISSDDDAIEEFLLLYVEIDGNSAEIGR
jgi:hypothetical protein